MATEISQGERPVFPRSVDGVFAERAASHRRVARASARATQMLPGPDALGWLSIGLAAAAVFAPRSVGRITGLGDRTSLLRLVGLRELASGLGLLTQENKTPWLAARVAGDVMDLAIALSAAGPDNPLRGRVFATLGVVGVIAAADLSACGRAASGRNSTEAYLHGAIVVNKPAQECYEFWRDVKNLPKFMHLVESVQPVDDRHTSWKVRGPGDVKLQWNTELMADEPARRLAWRARQDSGLQHTATVRFQSAKGIRGTLVTVVAQYHAAAGTAVVGVRKLLGSDPESLLREDLRRFKNLIEAGEVPSTRGQPSGRRSLLGRLIPEGRLSREGSPS
jgi:uncharacterized membrane protein